MKFLTFERGGCRAGLVINERIYDARKLGLLPPPGRRVLERPHLSDKNPGDGRAQEPCQAAQGPRQGPRELPLQCWASMDEVELHAPIPRPGKIICLGLNYRDHATEQNAKIPDNPLLFVKASTSTTGHNRPIVIPDGSTKVDFRSRAGFRHRQGSEGRRCE